MKRILLDIDTTIVLFNSTILEDAIKLVHMEKEIYIIGIAGRSGSGKSTLAKQLQEHFGKNSVHIDTDDFFVNSADFNCKEPSTKELEAMEKIHEELFKLKNGQSADFLTYDSAEKLYWNKKPTHYEPAQIIIMEGTMVLWDKKIRNISNFKIFVDTPDEICFQRRLDRQLMDLTVGSAKYEEEKKWNLDRWIVIREQWETYLEHTRRYADVIITSEDNGLEKVMPLLDNLV